MCIYISNSFSHGLSSGAKVVKIYKFDVIFSSTMMLWYYKSPFCIRPSKKLCTKNTEILGVREIKSSIEFMWLESFLMHVSKNLRISLT